MGRANKHKKFTFSKKKQNEIVLKMRKQEQIYCRYETGSENVSLIKYKLDTQRYHSLKTFAELV